jgi:hypothetical protein
VLRGVARSLGFVPLEIAVHDRRHGRERMSPADGWVEAARIAAGATRMNLKSVFGPLVRRRPNQFCCHAAATRGENSRDQEGRTGTPMMRKPAWSLQERELVGDLGLRHQGSSPPLRQKRPGSIRSYETVVTR